MSNTLCKVRHFPMIGNANRIETSLLCLDCVSYSKEFGLRVIGTIDVKSGTCFDCDKIFTQ